MSRRRTATHDNAPGSDSFLDIVANMVGIMIILVMVVGVQAKDAFLAGPPEESPAPVVSLVSLAESEPLTEDLNAKRQAVFSMKREVEELAELRASAASESALQLEVRKQLQEMAVAAEHMIEEEKSKLDAQTQQNFDIRRQVEAAREELEDLAAARLAVENTTAPVVQLKHLPTPMAKTVFGKEEHFRLSGGRLVYVPLNQLVDQMKQQAKMKLYKLEQSPNVTETVGPIDGFTMKYGLIRRRVEMSNGAVRELVDLDGFVLVPNSPVMGEPIERALEQGSDFRNRLGQFQLNTTTITIWTYPDSFGDFRKVKDELYKLGFLTAGRPMPEGHPIGGSPHGSRSGAQ